MRIKIPIILIAIITAFAACSGNFDRSDYVQWIENTDNGLLINRSTSSAEYILQYEPALYKALRISENEQAADLSEISMQFSDLHHFLLKVRTVDVAFQDDKEIAQYLAYELRKNIRFVEGADTIKQTVMYHLESSGSVTPYHRILIAFPKLKKKGNLKFIIDPGKLERDKLVFTFDKRIFEKLETINKQIE